MFKEIFSFELRMWLKRPGIYIYFLIFFLISFLIGAAASGMFGGVVSDTNTHLNSSLMVSGILTSFSSDYLLGLITILVCVALTAGCVQKDFQYNCFSFYFTKPFSKLSYLGGRFSASLLLAIVVNIGLMIGLFTAFSIAPNDNGQFGEQKLANYFFPFMIFTVPNIVIIASVFFSMVTWTRNMTSGYIGSLIFLVIAGIARTITSDIDNKTISGIIDPFGQQALGHATEYWTPAESNTRMVQCSGHIFLNRSVWLIISGVLLFFTYRNFTFNQFLNPVSIFKRKSKERTSQPSKLIQSIGQLPKATQAFNASFMREQIIFLTKFESLKIFRSVFFYIILTLCVLFTVLVNAYSGMIYGTETWPLTYMQIDTAAGLFTFFLLILIIFYSGVVVWRERDCKIDELVGASPVSNIVLFLSKFLSLILLCLALFVTCMITCMFIQTYKGYYNYEIGLYIKELFLLRIFSLISLVSLAVSLQVFFRNRYVGFFVMVIIMLGVPAILNAMHYRNDMFQFNSSGSQMPYSDMNGSGHTIGTFFVYKTYWMGLMLVLMSFAVAMYQRGKETGFKTRFKQGLKKFRLSYKLALFTGLFMFIGAGAVIYYNIRVLHPYRSEADLEKMQADFEKKYKKYEKELQPRVVESNLKVDIYPDELACKVIGYYYLKNKHKDPVTKLFINVPNECRSGFTLGRKSKKFVNDTVNGFFGYELEQPLAPGDSMQFEFDVRYYPKNFIMKRRSTEIVYNGTFFNSGYLPSIGYNPQSELDENASRRKHGLPPKPRMASVYDTAAYANTYISNDADWIRFEAVVSTKEGQIAIAPGYLIDDYKGSEPLRENEVRHYYHYKMDVPILNFYSFLSADYEVKRDKWVDPQKKQGDVNIEIYYHKGHDYNVDKMIEAIKSSLDYYTKNFSPYQHKQVRILEFPRYATFAQSFPNTIPYSEAIGFVAKMDEKNPEAIDYTYYVTAHEVAHQWWAHQVIGANVQGCTVMSETMSQYSALMVMEKRYGAAAMRKFLKYEMNSYLGARRHEGKKEVPIILCENQQYIHYNKGSVVMYALKDYIGEDTLNAALKRYIKKVGFQDAPFTTSLEFYEFIKAATPDSLKETVKDLFERIVVFDNGVKDWKYTKEGNGQYKITATIQLSKSQSDSLGKASDVKLNDWIDIGVFSKNEKFSSQLGEVIFLKKFKFTGKEQKIEFTVNKEPFMLGIDPFNKLIDKDPGDNSMDREGKEIGGGDPMAGSITVKSE